MCKVTQRIINKLCYRSNHEGFLNSLESWNKPGKVHCEVSWIKYKFLIDDNICDFASTITCIG